MKYLFILDYEHLDNGAFLKNLAQTLAYASIQNALFLHADSAYTERIMQTGVMRQDAQIRAIKELNHRLVALFADEGLAFSALNGYQKDVIFLDDDGAFKIDGKFINSRLKESNLLLSNLVASSEKVQAAAISNVAMALKKQLQFDEIIAFGHSPASGMIDDDMPIEGCPNELNGIIKDINLIQMQHLKQKLNKM